MNIIINLLSKTFFNHFIQLSTLNHLLYVSLTWLINVEIWWVRVDSEDPDCWTIKYCIGTVKNKKANCKCSRCNGILWCNFCLKSWKISYFWHFFTCGYLIGPGLLIVLFTYFMRHLAARNRNTLKYIISSKWTFRRFQRIFTLIFKSYSKWA